MPCALTGLIRREYDRDTEQAAYWSAAAALVPYGALRAMVHGGRETAVIAQHFEVSDALVAFRLKVTKLWKRRRC
jgi:Zn-dependent peptidase ImmA (M78 family)